MMTTFTPVIFLENISEENIRPVAESLDYSLRQTLVVWDFLVGFFFPGEFLMLLNPWQHLSHINVHIIHGAARGGMWETS